MRYLFDYMEDCIHLKACRRLQKIGRSKGHTFGRNCTEDCTAYISGDCGNYVTAKEACEYARREYDGHCDPYDVYCETDLETKTIGEIITEQEETP